MIYWIHSSLIRDFFFVMGCALCGLCDALLIQSTGGYRCTLL